MKILGKLSCWALGHKRGKRISGERSIEPLKSVTYACPRCGAQWTRKAKVKV